MESLEELDANFDGITYAKGCSVLKQFVAYAGLDPFLKGLHDYLLAHSYGNATFQDLLDAVSVYCDKDFRTWAEAWLTTTGRNTLSLDFDIASDPRDNSARYSSVTLHQTGAEPGAGELRPHRVGVGVYAMTATDSSSPICSAYFYTQIRFSCNCITGFRLLAGAKRSMVSRG